MPEEKCDVVGCDRVAERSLPLSRVSPYLDLSTGESGRGHKGRRRVHLCHEHYKEYKKKAKKDREIERLRWR